MPYSIFLKKDVELEAEENLTNPYLIACINKQKMSVLRVINKKTFG